MFSNSAYLGHIIRHLTLRLLLKHTHTHTHSKRLAVWGAPFKHICWYDVLFSRLSTFLRIRRYWGVNFERKHLLLIVCKLIYAELYRLKRYALVQWCDQTSDASPRKKPPWPISTLQHWHDSECTTQNVLIYRYWRSHAFISWHQNWGLKRKIDINTETFLNTWTSPKMGHAYRNEFRVAARAEHQIFNTYAKNYSKESTLGQLTFVHMDSRLKGYPTQQ